MGLTVDGLGNALLWAVYCSLNAGEYRSILWLGWIPGRFLEAAMAGNGVRKPTLPKASMGLGGILAQSETVVRAFGREKGFVLMMAAILAVVSVGLGTAVIVAKGVGRLLG
jgi:hypothetical protein